MRINQYIAQATGMSRRAADEIIRAGRVMLNDNVAELGSAVATHDTVKLDGKPIQPNQATMICINKPVGYVCSRDGQGSKTVYELLPDELHHLKPIGRLDKDSSGLLLLTNDGAAVNLLTHPKYNKQKVYEIELNKSLSNPDRTVIQKGIELDDGISKLGIEGKGTKWTIVMSEGRNRQIRRTFDALGYKVTKLHRTEFGEYKIDDLGFGDFRHIPQGKA